MPHKYRETARGGLAVSVVFCLLLRKGVSQRGGGTKQEEEIPFLAGFLQC